MFFNSSRTDVDDLYARQLINMSAANRDLESSKTSFHAYNTHYKSRLSLIVWVNVVLNRTVVVHSD